MKILFCAANSWVNAAHVGSHSLARALALQGHQVAFVGDPISPPHALAGLTSELKARFALWRKQGQWVEQYANGGAIWACVPAAPLTPHNKYLLRDKWVAGNWHHLAWPGLESMLKKAGFSYFDMVYVDSPTQAYWWRNFEYKKLVFRLADNPAGFLKHTPAAESALRDVAARADMLVYTAPALENLAETYNNNCRYLGNGVDYEFFSRPAPRPGEYNGLSGPVILYVGSMGYWFNYRWVRAAAQALPDSNFVLIGPAEEVQRYFNGYSNIRLLGSRPFKQLPAYMQHATVGMIPFDANNFPKLINNVNPLKLYEYLAAGLPVVAGRWQTLQELASPAHLVDSREEFIASLQSISAAGKNPALARQGQCFAAGHSWPEQAALLLEHLFNNH